VRSKQGFGIRAGNSSVEGSAAGSPAEADTGIDYPAFGPQMHIFGVQGTHISNLRTHLATMMRFALQKPPMLPCFPLPQANPQHFPIDSLLLTHVSSLPAAVDDGAAAPSGASADYGPDEYYGDEDYDRGSAAAPSSREDGGEDYENYNIDDYDYDYTEALAPGGEDGEGSVMAEAPGLAEQEEAMPVVIASAPQNEEGMEQKAEAPTIVPTNTNAPVPPVAAKGGAMKATVIGAAAAAGLALFI
jgi:hypothetical protein